MFIENCFFSQMEILKRACAMPVSKKILPMGQIQVIFLETGGSLLFSKPPTRLSPQNKRRPIALLFYHSFPEGEKIRIINLSY